MLKILLDMDGVLCNWEKRCCELFDVDWKIAKRQWPKGEFNINKILTEMTNKEINEKDIWKKVDKVGIGFWENLETYEWSKKLYKECQAIAPTYLVTKPSHHHTSLAGKLLWMKKFTKDDKFTNYMVGPKKELCSKIGNILIDDSLNNIKNFNLGNGKGILFPRWNNKNFRYSGCPKEYAIVKIREYRMEMDLMEEMDYINKKMDMGF